MYIIRKTVNGERSFKTYEGWVPVVEGVSLDLSDCIRFTNGESKNFKLNEGEEFIWFGSYKRTSDETR